MKNEKLTERQQLIKGYEARIKMHIKQLVTFKADHRKKEQEIERKIRLEKLTLKGLKNDKK